MSERSRAVAARPWGFSTLGMIVALTLLGFMLSPLLGTVLSAQRGFVANRERARSTSNVRYAHLALTRMMRLAGARPLGGLVTGIDPDPLGDGAFNDVRIRADYNPPDGDTNDPNEDLVFYLRSDTMYVRAGMAADAEEPFLIGVDSLGFEYFDRDGAAISDPARVAFDARSARVTLQARGRVAGPAPRALVGQVRLRNGR